MRIVKLCLPAVLIASLFSSSSYAAVQDRIASSLTNGQTVTLRGSVHRRALPQFDQGPVDPAMRMGTITLMTSPTAAQQRALTHLLAQQQDPKSANYHKWLTPEQYADRFGMSSNDMQKMAAWLKAKGFTVMDMARGRNWISFTGTAAQVNSAFGTEIHRYNLNGELHYANATSPLIPAALKGVVVGMRGLHDFRPKPMGIRRNSGLRPDYNSSNFGPLVAPGDIATIYDINALYTAGIDGSGQKLAVMGQTDIYLADIADFRSGFGLSPISCATNSSGVITACSDPHFSYVLDGTDPGLSTNGDISEADLDVEWAGAVARGAQIIYVNASDTFTALHYAIDNNVAPVISLSYGLCEFDDNGVLDSSGAPLGDESELQKASSMGITIANSTGDSGAAECDFGGSGGTLVGANLATQGLAVSYPASSPQVTGVGGTSIPLANFGSTYWSTSNGTDGNSALSYIPEQVWNDNAEIFEFCQQNAGNTFCTQGGTTAVSGWVPIQSAADAQADIGISSTGGGPSNCAIQSADNASCVSGFTQPTWQTVSIPGQLNARLSPDVSFLATPNYPGYIFCTPQSELGLTGTTSSCSPGGAAGITNALNLSSPSIIGGTSASAPVFAGIVVLMNQYLATTTGLGNVNPMLYTLALNPSNGAFNPVTTGDNNVACQVGSPAGTATDPWPTALQCPASGVFGFSASTADTTTSYNLVAGLGSVDVNNLAVAWKQLATQPGFSVSPSTSALTVIAGSDSNSTTITATPLNGFSGTVTYTCTAGLPSGATCTFTSIDQTSSSIVIQTSASMAGVHAATVIVTGTSGALSSSTAVSLDVTSTNESFTLALASGNPQVTQGASANVTIALTGANGFSSPVTYTCTDPATQSTCTGPASATAATSVSFMVTTAAPTVAAKQSSTRIFYALLLPGMLGILFVIPSRKRSFHAMRLLALIAVLGVSTMWLASCGGGSGGSTNGGTPPGTYTITVSGTTGGANPITAQTTFTLTVVQ